MYSCYAPRFIMLLSMLLWDTHHFWAMGSFVVYCVATVTLCTIAEWLSLSYTQSWYELYVCCNGMCIVQTQCIKLKVAICSGPCTHLLGGMCSNQKRAPQKTFAASAVTDLLSKYYKKRGKQHNLMSKVFCWTIINKPHTSAEWWEPSYRGLPGFTTQNHSLFQGQITARNH